MTYQAGVIGCGNAGSLHSEILNEHDSAELVGVVDPAKERRDTLRKSFDTNSYESVTQLISQEDLDGIHVCSPVQTHCAIALESIRKGIPTLIEKPLAASVTECHELISARDEHNVPVGVVHNRLYNDRMQKARKVIEKGDIGEVVAVDFISSTQADLSEATRGEWVFDLPAGELGETMPHHAYLTLAFVNRIGDISGVSVQNYRQYDRVAFDGLSLAAKDSTNNILVTLRAITNSTECYELTVYGTTGIMNIDLRQTPGIYLNSSSNVSPPVIIKNFAIKGVQLLTNFSELVLEELIEQVSNEPKIKQTHAGHFRIIDEFITAAEAGTKAPISLEEGTDTIKIIDTLSSASQT